MRHSETVPSRTGMKRAVVTTAQECWARCEPCGYDFRLGCSVPCPLAVYIAALKAASCPQCGRRGKNLSVYEPGQIGERE
jgi:hypothetical protein